ncbi:hypothetical protein QYE76_019369 [Lolium multiflorum]|uniref:Reverse transcriptase domain-containing protein n=1 Tax=Lolium multiflorum TaxID=4521 RepID=A0AAD8R3X8_LOLMU|nr:hypothetical protein QYE76_019369 [Lolium multiflorum]
MARSASSTSSVASNAMDGGKQIKTGLVDLVPHPPARVDAYAYLEEPMEMTFGSFHFCVGREGSHRLAAPICSGPLAVDSDFSGSSSSIKSSDEETSSASYVKPAAGRDLANLFGGMSFGSFTDSDLDSDSKSIDSFNFIDRSTSIREVFADRHDGVTDPEDEHTMPTYHQVCVIAETSRQEDEASLAFDDLGNPYIDPADLTRGLGSKTMPFGLKNAGATYQRMMQKCLATQIGKNVQVYIDDVVITTKQGLSLIDDLKETFDNLDKFRLKLNPTKCSFGVPAGELLGYLESARGIEANPEKIQAIVIMRKPMKLKEIQQLTGRVAALSRFVARLGEKALPFYALIKQGEKFEKVVHESFSELDETKPRVLFFGTKTEPKDTRESCHMAVHRAARPRMAARYWRLIASFAPPFRLFIPRIRKTPGTRASIHENQPCQNPSSGGFGPSGTLPERKSQDLYIAMSSSEVMRE